MKISIQEIKQMVEEEWNTYQSIHKETPLSKQIEKDVKELKSLRNEPSERERELNKDKWVKMPKVELMKIIGEKIAQFIEINGLLYPSQCDERMRKMNKG